MGTIYILGGAVVDVSLCPVNASIFERASTPIECIPMSTGGDAMNEASVLAKLGAPTSLITLLGYDAAGQYIMNACSELGIDTCLIHRSRDVTTSINVVLVDDCGERRFVTARNGSLRQLSFSDIQLVLDVVQRGDIVCLASLFVSPALKHQEMASFFKTLKEKGCTICMDMTRRKNNETVEDIQSILKNIDYLFCNSEEGELLTSCSEPDEIASKFVEYGATHAIIKLGKAGCYIHSSAISKHFPAYSEAHCLDTTGAGDTFAAAFIDALRRTMPLEDCIKFANAAASICIEHRGCSASALDLDEINRRMKLMWSSS